MTNLSTNDEAHWEYYQIAQRRSYDAPDVKEGQESLARLTRKYGRKGGNLLETGFGNGYLLTLLQSDFRCTGIDISAANVARTRSELNEQGFNDIAFVSSNILAYNPEKQFDVILASHVIEHFRDADLRTLLEKFYTLLRSGGVLIGAVPYRQDLELARRRCPSCACVFDPDGHEQSFDKPRLEGFLKNAGFRRAHLDTHVIGLGVNLRSIAKRVKYLFSEGAGGLQFAAFK